MTCSDKPAELIAAAYLGLRPYRKRVIALIAASLLLCSVVTYSLGLKEDISALIPTAPPELARNFTYLQKAPFMQYLTVALSLDGHDPEELAELFRSALQEQGISQVFTGPGVAFSPKKLADLCALTPNLASSNDLARLEPLLLPERIAQTVEGDVHKLVSPDGFALRELIALDPLGLCPVLASSAKEMRGVGGIQVRNGYFTDETGRAALVFIKPNAAMTDALASGAFMQDVRQAVSRLPEGTNSHMLGSYRHSEHNALVIKEDLGRVLPLSSALTVLLFFLLVRKREGLTLLIVPFSAFGVAGVATAAAFGGVSGIVLGFGSVLLGITADYAIHTYFAISSSAGVEGGLKSVFPHLAVGAATTAAAFIVLALSSIPAVQQMAFFALVGVLAAFLFSLFVLPLLVSSGTEQPTGSEKPQFRPLMRVLPAAGLAALFLAIILSSFILLHFDGDIRNLTSVSQDILQEEQIVRGMRQDGGSGTALIVAAGEGSAEGLEKALRINDAVYTLLKHSPDIGKGTVTSIAPLLPSERTQEQNRTAWREFWQKRVDIVWQTTKDEARTHGFTAEAFLPFKQWIYSAPQSVTLEGLRKEGLGFMTDMSIAETPDASLVYTVLANGAALGEDALRALEKAGGVLISGESFREEMSVAIGHEMLFSSLVTFATVVLAMIFFSRSLLRALFILLPMLSGFAFVLGFFYCTGTPVNFFHGMAFPLVIALSLDYGIFMQAVLERRLEGEGKKAVIFSALTTLAGFGCLLLARHPALFSLGFAVSGGIAASFVTAVWGLPLLEKKTRDGALSTSG